MTQQLNPTRKKEKESAFKRKSSCVVILFICLGANEATIGQSFRANGTQSKNKEFSEHV